MSTARRHLSSAHSCSPVVLVLQSGVQRLKLYSHPQILRSLILLSSTFCSDSLKYINNLFLHLQTCFNCGKMHIKFTVSTVLSVQHIKHTGVVSLLHHQPAKAPSDFETKILYPLTLNPHVPSSLQTLARGISLCLCGSDYHWPSCKWDHTVFIFSGCDWLISLGIFSSWSLHVVTSVTIFFLLGLNNVSVHTLYYLSIHALTDAPVVSTFWILWRALL